MVRSCLLPWIRRNERNTPTDSGQGNTENRDTYLTISQRCKDTLTYLDHSNIITCDEHGDSDEPRFPPNPADQDPHLARPRRRLEHLGAARSR